jgi:hypothetical protein
MVAVRTRTFEAANVRSLVWRGDDLVDWVGGGAVFRPDGSIERARVRYAYRFDSAMQGPDGYACIYERCGTKGLLLHDGQVVRELDRSFYHANAYEYPIALFRGPDGRTRVVHCPEHYNRLEIEDAETGKPETQVDARVAADFFHSRLAANPSGTRFLSAGWAWHPWSQISFYEVARALEDPRHLDPVHGTPDGGHVGLSEEVSAAWQTEDRVLIATSDEPEELAEGEEADPRRLRPRGIGVFDLVAGRLISSVVLERPAGTMMPVGTALVLCLFEPPRLVDLQSGEVVHAWPDLATGTQTSSILLGKLPAARARSGAASICSAWRRQDHGGRDRSVISHARRSRIIAATSPGNVHRSYCCAPMRYKPAG